MSNQEETLESMAINRLAGDLMENTMTQVQNSFALIIVDSYSSRILSSYMTMTEVLNRGIFSIEGISNTKTKKRQSFPNYHAIYFISPTLESCQQISKDFEDLSKPMYSRIHIFFTHPVKPEIFDKIVSEGVIKRAITCKNLNLSFIVRDPNVYDLGIKSGLKIFTMLEDDKQKILTEVSNRLFTVCATMNICPYVQYQSSSYLCTQLSKLIEPLINDMSKEKKINRAGLLLLTDRTIDPTTPLLHDYNYEAVIYDLMDTQGNIVEINNKKSKLDNRDELWNKYRKMHIAQVFETLPKDLEIFQQSDVSKSTNKNLNSFEDMANVLSNMGEYKLKTGFFSLHLSLAEEINKRYKERNIFNMIELEQDIVSGENEKGFVNTRDIFKNFTMLKAKLQQLDNISNDPNSIEIKPNSVPKKNNDLLRLLLTVYLNMTVQEKDFNVMRGKLPDDEMNIFTTLKDLGISTRDKVHVNNKSMKKEKSNIKQSSKLSQDMNFSTLRAQGTLEFLVQKASNYELDLKEYPIVNWDKSKALPKIEKKFGTKNLFVGNSQEKESTEDLGTLVLFTIGGIAHNEVAAIEMLKNNNMLNHRIVVGGTSIINANDYINELKDLHTDYKDKLTEDLLLKTEGEMVKDSSIKEVTLDLKPIDKI